MLSGLKKNVSIVAGLADVSVTPVTASGTLKTNAVMNPPTPAGVRFVKLIVRVASVELVNA
jgi:hypothetical protein